MNLLKLSRAREPPTNAFAFAVAGCRWSALRARFWTEGLRDGWGVRSRTGESFAMLYTSRIARLCSFSVGFVIRIVVALAAASAAAEAISPPWEMKLFPDLRMLPTGMAMDRSMRCIIKSHCSNVKIPTSRLIPFHLGGIGAEPFTTGTAGLREGTASAISTSSPEPPLGDGAASSSFAVGTGVSSLEGCLLESPVGGTAVESVFLRLGADFLYFSTSFGSDTLGSTCFSARRDMTSSHCSV